MNMGLFATALGNGNTAWISTGGAKSNDFFTIYHGIHMSTARMTGSNKSSDSKQPSKQLQGARIFKMTQNADASFLNMASYSLDE